MATAATPAHRLPGGATWSHVLRRGEALEVEDLEGGANAALLLVNPHEPTERLNVPDTLKAQHVARITAGVALFSDMGRVMASVVEDTCGWHDPLAGHARTAELEALHGPSSFAAHGNDARRGAREELLAELAKHGLGARDLMATVNLFAKVTADGDGRLVFHPGASPPGGRVVLRADMDVLVLLNTCPHPLAQGAWDPRPVGLAITEVGAAGTEDPVRLACPENERGFAATDRHPPEQPAMTETATAPPTLDPADATMDRTIQPGDGWIGEVPSHGHLRIVDLHGNQAVDTLLYDAHDHAHRYSAQDTIRGQGAIYLTTGSRLLTGTGASLATIVADTCGRHDTLGGACSQESNVARYGEHTRHMHACRQTFLAQALAWGRGLDKRDLTHNINFFMNVPVTPEGGLTFEDGVSAPGRHVELRADRDVLVLISNCPQLNNPCNGYDPTPVRLLMWEAGR